MINTDDPWATLSDEERWCRPYHQPPTHTTHKPAEPFHRRPLPPWGDRKPDLHCSPECLTCERPENRCLCTNPAIVCDHTRPGGHCRADCNRPSKRTTNNQGDIHICLITGPRTPARLTAGPGTAELLAVPCCPHCGRAHRHTSHPTAHPYRTAPCGRPYLLEISTWKPSSSSSS